MSQRTIRTTPPNALDEFLPERLFNLRVRSDGERVISIVEQLSPNDLRLDPIEHVHDSATGRKTVGASVGTKVGTRSVQLWPMLAAGFVALGVMLLVLTMFAKYLNRVV